MSLLARFFEADPKGLLTSNNCNVDWIIDNTSVETLIEMVAQLNNVVKTQQTTIDKQRRKIDELSDASISSVNTILDLSK